MNFENLNITDLFCNKPENKENSKINIISLFEDKFQSNLINKKKFILQIYNGLNDLQKTLFSNADFVNLESSEINETNLESLSDFDLDKLYFFINSLKSV